jgi:hypothetical protein
MWVAYRSSGTRDISEHLLRYKIVSGRGGEHGGTRTFNRSGFAPTVSKIFWPLICARTGRSARDMGTAQAERTMALKPLSDQIWVTPMVAVNACKGAEGGERVVSEQGARDGGAR